MTITTATGTCLSVSAALPATHTEAGFAALAYTQVGELETLGELVVEFTAASFTNLCSGKTRMLKGEEKYSPVQIGVGLDRDDAGQSILTTARKSRVARVAVRVADADGTVVFFQAQVMAEKIVGGDAAGEVRRGAYTLGVYMPPDADPVVQTSAALLPPSLESIAAYLDAGSGGLSYTSIPYGAGEQWIEQAAGSEVQRQAFDLTLPPGPAPVGGRPVVAYLHAAGSTKYVAPGSAVDVQIKQPALAGDEVFVSAWHRNPKTNFNWNGANGVPVTDAGLLLQQLRALAPALGLDPNNILVIGSSKGNDYLTATFSGNLANPSAPTYAGRQSSLPTDGYSVNPQVYYDPGKWATKFVPPANQAAFLAAEPANPLMPNAAELIATCPVECLIPLVMVHDAAFVAYPHISATTDIHFSGNATEALLAYTARGYAHRISIWASDSAVETKLGTALPYWRNRRAGMSVREALAVARARQRSAALWYARADLSGLARDSAGTLAPAVDQVVGAIVDGSYGLANRANVATALGYSLGQPGGDSLKPTLRAKGNGQLCIRFDASNDKLLSSYVSDGTPNFRAWADVMYSTYISASTTGLQIGVGTTETALAGKDVSLMLAQDETISAADLRIYANFAQELSGVAYASQTP